MKALRDFKFGDKQISKNAPFEEDATKEQIAILKKRKFIGPSKKTKKKSTKEQ